jgi:prophage regulatory protein
MDTSQAINSTLNTPPRLMRMSEVSDRCGLSKSSIYSLIRDEKFPKPFKVIGRRGNVFVESEVTDWIYDRIHSARSDTGE